MITYIHTMDVWQLLCFLGTFFCLTEYCAVLYLTKISTWDLELYEQELAKVSPDKLIKPQKPQKVKTRTRKFRTPNIPNFGRPNSELSEPLTWAIGLTF